MAEKLEIKKAKLPFHFDENGKVAIDLGPRPGTLTKFLLSLSKVLHRPLNLHNFEAAVLRLRADNRAHVPFWTKLSVAYGQKVEFDSRLLESIPKNGPLLIASNHPLNGVEGIAIAAMISQVRPDVLVVMTPFLDSVPGMAKNAIYMSPDGGRDSVALNRQARHELALALKSGKCVVMFPSGQVSLKKKLSDKEVFDSVWKPTVAKILSEAKESKVLLIFVDGQSSRYFQMAKKLEELVPSKFKGLRMAINIPMHVREIGSHFDKAVKLIIGPVLSAEKLLSLSNADLAHTLRTATYDLKNSTQPSAQTQPFLWQERD